MSIRFLLSLQLVFRPLSLCVSLSLCLSLSCYVSHLFLAHCLSIILVLSVFLFFCCCIPHFVTLLSLPQRSDLLVSLFASVLLCLYWLLSLWLTDSSYFCHSATLQLSFHIPLWGVCRHQRSRWRESRGHRSQGLRSSCWRRSRAHRKG